MWVVNKFGRVVEMDDEQAALKAIADGRLREATQDEIDLRSEYKARLESVPASDSIYYQTVQPSMDGYGVSRDHIKSELHRLGVHLNEVYDGQKVGLLYNYPYGMTSLHTDVRLIYTMFESDKLPEDWAEYLAEADQVLVPSKFCQETFAKAGIESTVVPLGYNDRRFDFIERPVPVEHDEPFTFIHYDSFNTRKGFMEVLKAFTEEFKSDEPARLIMKTAKDNAAIPILPSQYPNIEVVTGRMSEDDLLRLLGRANCMVYPSRGEGFGLTPLEAMATGMPAIVPNAHGISEYFDPKFMLEVKVADTCPALYNRYKGQDVGVMVLPDVDHLREQMRFAFNHQRDMYALGRRASRYARNFTYRKTADRLAEIIRSWEAKEVDSRKDGRFLRVEAV